MPKDIWDIVKPYCLLFVLTWTPHPFSSSTLTIPSHPQICHARSPTSANQQFILKRRTQTVADRACGRAVLTLRSQLIRSLSLVGRAASKAVTMATHHLAAWFVVHIDAFISELQAGATQRHSSIRFARRHHICNILSVTHQVHL